MEFRIARAACEGTSHRATGVVCQDKTAEKILPCYSVIALADGAGSCEYSHLGAQCVVDYVVQSLSKNAARWLNPACDDAVLATELVQGCKAALGALNYPLETLSSTLLFALAEVDGRYLCGQIGDGYTFLADETSASVLLFPENGQYANETYFVTMENAVEHCRFTRGHLQAGECIILASDGASEALYNGYTSACAPALSKIAQWANEYNMPQVSQALSQNLNEVIRQHTEDDMSIALLAAYSTDDFAFYPLADEVWPATEVRQADAQPQEEPDEYLVPDTECKEWADEL